MPPKNPEKRSQRHTERPERKVRVLLFVVDDDDDAGRTKGRYILRPNTVYLIVRRSSYKEDRDALLAELREEYRTALRENGKKKQTRRRSTKERR